MKIAPSILSSDFARLGDEIRRITEAGADYIHVDVMDGLFVKNITIGPPVVRAIRSYSSLPFDVHLMISEPSRYIEAFAKAGADIITIHAEAEPNILETIKKIKAFGVKVGLAIKPNTPIEVVYPYLHLLDLVLVMTVEPGFGGQVFMQDMLSKVEALKTNLKTQNLSTLVEVDGGINKVTARLSASSGADICVAGTYIFDSRDVRCAIDSLR